MQKHGIQETPLSIGHVYLFSLVDRTCWHNVHAYWDDVLFCPRGLTQSTLTIFVLYSYCLANYVGNMLPTRANVGRLRQKLHVGATQQRPGHTPTHPICINNSQQVQISPNVWVPYLQYIFCVWAKKKNHVIADIDTCCNMLSNVVSFSPPSRHEMLPCRRHEHQRVDNILATQNNVSANQGSSQHDRKRHGKTIKFWLPLTKLASKPKKNTPTPLTKLLLQYLVYHNHCCHCL